MYVFRVNTSQITASVTSSIVFLQWVPGAALLVGRGWEKNQVDNGRAQGYTQSSNLLTLLMDWLPTPTSRIPELGKEVLLHMELFLGS